MKDVDAWLRTFVSALRSKDPALADEIRALPRARSLSASVRNIVLRVGRPVLAIVGDRAQLTFKDGESTVWRTRLQASGEHLRRAAQAVGRIEVTGLPGVPYVGTGWLVDRDIVVTNRHVALTFARPVRGGFAFQKGSGAAPLRACVDFLEEAGRRAQRPVPIVEVLHIEDETGPDLAFLRLDAAAGGRPLAPPIALQTARVSREQQVAVIGYPARDSRVPDQQLLHDIFGDVFDKKRLAPGQVTGTRRGTLLHDCSTLGGNSGSVVLDLATGQAVGVHFAGRFLEANYAVPAAVVAARLERLHDPKPPAPSPGRPPSDLIVEGVPSDYAGRTGYDAAFLGPKGPLPVIRNKRDVVTFPWNGRRESVLKYQHFSVVMSRSRRMCVFSACNIDGSRPHRFKRPAWRMDPRIPAQLQIRDECYGNEPLFARGHMTRREDPIWGTPEEAALGNVDSMHVTNTVPQMQPFNAGIWLALESYALEHARQDRMRISVFTGPFFAADDPVREGVRIPRSFWKVIAFIHDETRQLCATGYTMSQEDFLRDEEFVFGRHKTAQTRVADIERRAGVSFGRLAARDPYDGADEGVAGVLTDLSQIRFVSRRV